MGFPSSSEPVSIAQPMPMAVEFDGAIDSGKNKGSVTLGDFGTRRSRIAAAVRMHANFVRSVGALIAILALALSYMRLTRCHASIQRAEYTTATWLS
jgi:hypothetical protein